MDRPKPFDYANCQETKPICKICARLALTSRALCAIFTVEQIGQTNEPIAQTPDESVEDCHFDPLQDLVE